MQVEKTKSYIEWLNCFNSLEQEVLKTLAAKSEPACHVEIAMDLDLSAATIAQVCDRLEEKKLIQKDYRGLFSIVDKSKPTIASICTSGGVLEQGAIAAGLKPIWGIEIDPEIAAVYRANYPESEMVVADASTLNYTTLASPTILHASPSCRNYSQANDKIETEADRALAVGIARAIATLQPEVFTLENVRAYASSEAWREIRDRLEKLGYSVQSQVVKLNLWGVPQKRVRFIAIATRDVPAPLLFTPNRTKHWHQEISDLIPQFKKSSLTNTQQDNLTAKIKGAIAQGIPVIVKRNQIRSYTPASSVGEPAWTVTAKLCTDGKGSDRHAFADLITPGGVFSLTTRALARMQTIPDTYNLTGNVRIDGMVIGDGVPSYFAEQMYGQILDYLEEDAGEPSQGSPRVVRNDTIKGVKPPRDVALGEAEHPGGVKPVLEASNMNIISKTPEYRAFNGAKSRCNNSANPSYKNYGGRGIQFKFSSFEEFINHVGFRPSGNHSIDRINNNGHYEIGNVRWARARGVGSPDTLVEGLRSEETSDPCMPRSPATDIEQARNKRVCVPVSLIDVESNKVIKEFSTISDAVDSTDYSFESIYNDCNKSNLDIDQKIVWTYSKNVEETLLFYKDIDAYRILKKSKLIGGSKKSTIVEENLSEEEVDVLIKYVHGRILKLNKYFNVGSALLEIKRLKLYKIKGYKSFEKFCLEEFEYKKTRLYQIINVAKVLNSLPSDIDPFLLDLTESHCRELNKIKDVELRSLILRQAADSGTITAKAIAVTHRKLKLAQGQTRTKRDNPPVGSVVRLTTKQNPELKIYNGYWGIVTEVYEYSCDIQILGYKAIALSSQDFVEIKDIDKIWTKNLLDRLNGIYSNPRLNDTGRKVISAIATNPYPKLDTIDECLVTALENAISPNTD